MSCVTRTLIWTSILLCAWCWPCATTSNTTTPKAAVSQPVVTPHCIRSVQDLISAFRDRQTWLLNTSTFQEDSLFDFSVSFALSYRSYAVYYEYPEAEPGDYNLGSGRCCNLSDGGPTNFNCKAFINHHKKVYQVLPGALVFLFGSPMYIILGPKVFRETMATAIQRFCWSIPPFCPEVLPELSEAMLSDFTLVVSAWVHLLGGFQNIGCTHPTVK